MPYDVINLEKKDNVLIVTLNCPEKKNVVSPQLVKELESVFHSLGHHGRGVGAMVLYGGPDQFCAGLDLETAATLTDHDMDHFIEDLASVFLAMQTSDFPIIAAIDGPALAQGFDLAVMSDIRLASPSAAFGQPEITMGVSQLIDPLWKIVGLGRARELAMTGKVINAEEAYRIGLVNKLAESGELYDRALELAEELAEKDAHAMSATKKNCRLIPGMETIQALESQMATFRLFVDTRDKRKHVRD